MLKAGSTGNSVEEQQALNAANDLLNLTPKNDWSAWQRAFRRVLLMKLIDYNLAQNHIGSSKYYFGVLEHQVNSFKKNELKVCPHGLRAT